MTAINVIVIVGEVKDLPEQVFWADNYDDFVCLFTVDADKAYDEKRDEFVVLCNGDVARYAKQCLKSGDSVAVKGAARRFCYSATGEPAHTEIGICADQVYAMDGNVPDSERDAILASEWTEICMSEWNGAARWACNSQEYTESAMEGFYKVEAAFEAGKLNRAEIIAMLDEVEIDLSWAISAMHEALARARDWQP